MADMHMRCVRQDNMPSMLALPGSLTQCQRMRSGSEYASILGLSVDDDTGGSILPDVTLFCGIIYAPSHAETPCTFSIVLRVQGWGCSRGRFQNLPSAESRPLDFNPPHHCWSHAINTAIHDLTLHTGYIIAMALRCGLRGSKNNQRDAWQTTALMQYS